MILNNINQSYDIPFEIKNNSDVDFCSANKV